MGMSPSCHCICPGTGGGSPGSGSGSGGSGSGSGFPTNTGCTRCTDLITPVRMKLTWAPGTDCAGDWQNAAYAGPFICHWVGMFGVGINAFCVWRTTEKELEVDTGNEPVSASERVGIGLSSTGWFASIQFHGATQAGVACTATGGHDDGTVSYVQSPAPTVPLNCLTSVTLPYSSQSNPAAMHIAMNGLRYKNGTNPFPATVFIEPAP